MGLSIIFIVLSHGSSNGVIYPFPLNKLIIGSLGTICFFLLSGMGMYYSLSKLNAINSTELLFWYKKRYTRLLVPYFILSLPVFAINTFHEGGSFIDFILRVTTISFWYPPHKGMWFIAMIIPLYFVSPIVFDISKRLKSQWSIFTFFVITIVVMILIGKYTTLDDAYFYKSIFFFLGMWIAPSIMENKQVNWILVILFTIPFWFISRYIPIIKDIPRVFFLFPTFLIITCTGFNYISQYGRNIISRLSVFLGKISLEIYLTHIYFAGLLIQFNVSFFPKYPLLTAYIQYTLIVIISIICSVYVNKLSKVIMKRMNL